MFRKTFPLISIANNSLWDLAAPINLTVNWNFGSLLGLVLVNQLLTGILLSIRYTRHVTLAFERVVNITQDTSYGWLLRLLHSRGASYFFLFMYLHIGRGLYYWSFTKTVLWVIGVVIYLISMGTAFLGYVLPWGQMRYWAATVITNLLSAVPLVGTDLVVWVWGGFAVGNPTLTRFYSLHFLLPFVIVALVVLHIYFLHLYERGNPLGIPSTGRKVRFHYYYTIKDTFLFLVFISFFILTSLMFGYDFMDAENFIPANILVTPIHIQPEWYFLFAYAILRAIPNKLGGVVGLLLRVLVLMMYAVKTEGLYFRGFNWGIADRFLFWRLVNVFGLLTWLGTCPAEYPYNDAAALMTVLYFVLHLGLYRYALAMNARYMNK